MRYLILSIVSLALISQAFSAILHCGELDDHDYVEVKTERAASEKPNLVFLGASMVELGINPEVFDAAMAEGGIATHSYNLGIGGLSVPELSYVIDRFKALDHDRVDYAIIAPCFLCLTVADHTDNVRSINFFSLMNSIEFTRYIFSYKVLPWPYYSRVRYVGNILSAMLRHYTNFGLARIALGWTNFMKIDPNFRDPSMWRVGGPRGAILNAAGMKPEIEHGYLDQIPSVRVQRPALIRDLINHTTPAADPLTNQSLAPFFQAVADLRAQGIKVLVVLPPSIGEWNYDAGAAARIRLQCEGLPFIDFGDIDSHQDLVPADLHYDGGHLNADGATVWSKDLATALVRLIQEDSFSHETVCSTATHPG